MSDTAGRPVRAVAQLVRRARPARRWWRVLGWLLVAVFVLVLVPAVGSALKGQDWSVVTAVAERGDRGRIALLLTGALLAAMVGPLLGLLSWRAIVLDLAPVKTVHVVRMFFIGFFSKYMPVKGLAMVVGIRAASAGGLGLAGFFGSGILSFGVTALTGLAVGLLASAELFGATAGWLVLVLAPIALLVYRPQLVNRAGGLAMRLLRRPAPDSAVSARGMRRAVTAQSLAWLVSGLHLWLLAMALDAAPVRSLPLCVGAFGLATVLGLLVVVVPDGIGVRESILMAALTLVLPTSAAAAVVLASRLVTTVGEVAVGALALAAAEITHRRAKRHTGSATVEGRQHVPVDG